MISSSNSASCSTVECRLTVMVFVAVGFCTLASILCLFLQKVLSPLRLLSILYYAAAALSLSFSESVEKYCCLFSAVLVAFSSWPISQFLLQRAPLTSMPLEFYYINFPSPTLLLVLLWRVAYNLEGNESCSSKVFRVPCSVHHGRNVLCIITCFVHELITTASQCLLLRNS